MGDILNSLAGGLIQGTTQHLNNQVMADMEKKKQETNAQQWFMQTMAQSKMEEQRAVAVKRQENADKYPGMIDLDKEGKVPKDPLGNIIYSVPPGPYPSGQPYLIDKLGSQPLVSNTGIPRGYTKDSVDSIIHDVANNTQILNKMSLGMQGGPARAYVEAGVNKLYNAAGMEPFDAAGQEKKFSYGKDKGNMNMMIKLNLADTTIGSILDQIPKSNLTSVPLLNKYLNTGKVMFGNVPINNLETLITFLKEDSNTILTMGRSSVVAQQFADALIPSMQSPKQFLDSLPIIKERLGKLTEEMKSNTLDTGVYDRAILEKKNRGKSSPVRPQPDPGQSPSKNAKARAIYDQAMSELKGQ
jgi:hypothetical protein